ncbi:hypothetical protein P4S68_04700 [Pseudoalteromonas sp. Hal099]
MQTVWCYFQLEHTILQVNKAARKLFSQQDILTGEPLKMLFDEAQWQEIKMRFVTY